ncbi:DUF512 domain-containing protein [Gehongia tenuis]|uniref:DUF512 domain-containing protein n=1 Tax=Gehongia tenuis TaxID=2763655 RepID=A0A926D585_9FIRM|nr:DUF512 domain-containing protein [Gehongia tenuis]MBC8531491.1 DUF512 domain-containing protein [Gehongia tenuis]
MHRIVGVKGRLARRLGVEPGDELISIDGQDVVDVIDYEALCSQSRLTLGLRRKDQDLELAVVKDEDEPLGLIFEDNLMGEVRRCQNHCVFCFVDQHPRSKIRDTLRVKDDDWRLSLIMGNYVTLTNVNNLEFERILRRKVSPLYISVHATDPEVRTFMLGRKKEAPILPRLNRLAKANLHFYAQVVLCPGLNDGKVLDQTIEELSGLHPASVSMAVVPVGMTRFREGLYPLQAVDEAKASELLDQIGVWQERLLKRLGTRFVFPADELYWKAGRTLPPPEAYEDYPQLENGVGLVAKMRSEVLEALKTESRTVPGRRTIATGVAAEGWIRELISAIPGGERIKVKSIQNRYYGESITVTGLLTGGDLIEQLKDEDLGEALFISDSMLRSDEDIFLDDVTLEDVENALQIPVFPVPQLGEDFLRVITREVNG